MYETSCQSRFDARYWMLGAGALGRPRGMEWGTAPTWRQDVTCDADISEEIARMHSYDKIESHNPELALRQGKEDPMEEVKGEAEDYLASAGLDEVMTYTFIHPSFVDKMMLKTDDARRTRR